MTLDELQTLNPEADAELLSMVVECSQAGEEELPLPAEAYERF
ncbi:hypothetical protein [Prosthecobacter vanneervenii]|uniref:Uncharacterized protein n=1 Tax=Prosthecobacter vanneervenii TaxID=48466 RepID=A0A7W8DKE7_9BACT|nr:hypothetical protein [Prosthecobacter vanneervenii]MBB5033169.1 hypothetical protein [Prosthecobacter vanneervenii]